MFTRKNLSFRLVQVISILFICLTACVQDGTKKHEAYKICYRCEFDSITKIKSVNQTGKVLSDELIIPPGYYACQKQVYPFIEEGLYRVFNAAGGSVQRIVYKNDIYNFISSLAWIVSHGSKDNGIPYTDLSKQASKRKVYLTCGYSSAWVTHLLKKQGIGAREVVSLTLEEWNELDNGHNMIEVSIDGNWVLVDIDNNYLFKYRDRLLNAKELFGLENLEEVELVALSADDKNQTPWIQKNNKNDFTFLAEYNTSNEIQLRNWYKRVFQVLLIKKGVNLYYIYRKQTEINQRIESYSERIIPLNEQQFIKTFYENSIN